MNRKHSILLGCLAAGLAACGGGGGGGSSAPATTTSIAIRGTAASGAPITGNMNAIVTIKDSSTTPKLATTTTDALGNYTFTHTQIDGMTPPLMEEVDYQVAGTHYYLNSAATATDLLAPTATINITPFTDLIIANIAGDIATNVFNNNSYKTTLTASALQAGSAALATILTPVLTSLGVSASVDLFHDSFSANGTGLDQVLDVVKVTQDPVQKTATLTNATNSNTLNVDMTQPLASVSQTLPAPGSTTTVTDLQAVQNAMASFLAVINGSPAPTATTPALLAFFDQANFLDDGQNLSAFLQNILDPTVAGHLDLQNISLSPVPADITLPASLGTVTAYLVSFQVVQSGQPQDMHSFVLYQGNNGWLVLGDLRQAKTRLQAVASKAFAYSGPSTLQAAYCSGLDIDIKDPGNLYPNGSSSPVPLSYAIVTGPGLPAAGALYFNSGGQLGNDFAAAVGGPSTFVGPNTPARNSNGACVSSTVYALADADIASVASAFNTATGAVYTYQLFVDTSYAAGNTPLLTYTQRLASLPLTNASVTDSLFPTALSATPVFSVAATAASITSSTVSWTNPATAGLGLSDAWFCVGLNSTSSPPQCLDKQLQPTATSLLLAVPNFSGSSASQIYASASLAYYDTQDREYLFGTPVN